MCLLCIAPYAVKEEGRLTKLEGIAVAFKETPNLRDPMHKFKMIVLNNLRIVSMKGKCPLVERPTGFPTGTFQSWLVYMK